MKLIKVTKKDIDLLKLGAEIDKWPKVRAEYANKALDDIYRGHGTHGLLAYDGDELVGVLSYEVYRVNDPSDLINLSFLGTAHRGVGAKMVDEVKREDTPRIVLIAEAGANPF